LAIDDGTGYSSMSYLQGFLRLLKIDRAFVDGSNMTPTSGARSRAMIELGHALDLSTSPKGRDVSEAALLRKMQADQVQGYVFSRPVPAVM
jgi:EAL domain-containing protein (putative c-di-GMP-specific phosphodiesterase class I)